MPNPELKEGGKALDLVFAGLNVLHESKDPFIRSLAVHANNGLHSRSLLILVDDDFNETETPHITSDYGFFVDEENGRGRLKEGLGFNANWLFGRNGLSAKMIAGDLLRTIHIADQAERGLYTRRLKEVYADGQEVQKKWLIENSIPEIVNDPRDTDGDPLLGALGEPRYYSDIGFDDWRKTLIGARRDYRYRANWTDIDALEDNGKARFAINRQNRIPIIHDELTEIFGERYTTLMTQEQRTANVENMLLDKLIGREKERPRGLFVVK